MADNNPPQTLQLDPPKTLQLDAPAPTSTPQAPERGVLENLVGGVVEHTAKGVTGLANLAAEGIEKATGMPSGSLQSRPGPEVEQPSMARDLGGDAAAIGEFMMGDTALEGLARAAKVTSMAKRIPLIRDTLAMAKEHPVIAKMIGEGFKGGTVGGAQGAEQGAAEGKAAEEAKGGMEGGAAGGGIVGGLVEAATPIAEGIAKRFGIGTSAEAEAKRAAQPGKRNYKFAEDFQKAAPYLDAVNAKDPAATIEDWADHAKTARESIYKNTIEPAMERVLPNGEKVGEQPLGGLNIANGIRKAITKTMQVLDSNEAAKIEQLANQFLPGQQFQLQVKDAEQYLQHYNAKLGATGFWSKMPSERADLLKTNGEMAGYKAAADSIRDEMYGRLKQLAPDVDFADLKKDYGALRNVEDELRGRINVNDRQGQTSLREAIGIITGLAHGGPVGVGIAGLPIVEKFANTPVKAMGRAVQKAARPGEEAAVSKAVTATGRALKKGGPEAAAMGGAALGRIVFTASDGTLHSIPNDPQALAHAKTIDPNLQVHE